MITCPTCSSSEYEGTLFCSRCGRQLFQMEVLEKDSGISSLGRENRGKASGSSVPATQPDAKSPVLSLQVMECSVVIPLAGRVEFTLGRSNEGQMILPDIDLSEFQAYEKGVSRLHASVRIGEKQVTITDLGSINGTHLNEQKLEPNQPYPVKNGDVLTLGRLAVRVVVHT